MKRMFLDSLQAALNAYLALDPETRTRYRQLQDKAVTIELLGVGVVFQLLFSEQGIRLMTDDFHPADTTIQGTPLRLLHIALSPDNRQRFFSEDAAILGSAEVGQAVMDLFDQLDIDWEEQLSHWTGDVPAHQVGRFIRGIKRWYQQARQTLSLHVNEYIHEEVTLFPPTEAIHDFFTDVDLLRMDVDRLAARVDRLTVALEQRKKDLL